MDKGRKKVQKKKPWYKKFRKRQPPPTRIENPLRGGTYDRREWRKEALKEYENSDYA